jgi:ribosomal 50S subunit-recycling heat shock protein
MRLDLFLKSSRLVPRRTIAQQMCEAGAVRLNGAHAKSGRDIKIGDQISIRSHGRITTVRILEVPLRPPPKARAASLYETLGIETYDPE